MTVAVDKTQIKFIMAFEIQILIVIISETEIRITGIQTVIVVLVTIKAEAVTWTVVTAY